MTARKVHAHRPLPQSSRRVQIAVATIPSGGSWTHTWGRHCTINIIFVSRRPKSGRFITFQIIPMRLFSRGWDAQKIIRFPLARKLASTESDFLLSSLRTTAARACVAARRGWSLAGRAGESALRHRQAFAASRRPPRQPAPQSTMSTERNKNRHRRRGRKGRATVGLSMSSRDDSSAHRTCSETNAYK